MNNKDKLMEKLEAALTEISEGKGRYSMDILEHASNTIADIKDIALNALSEISQLKSEAKEEQPLSEYIKEYLIGIGGIPTNEQLYQEFDMHVREALGIIQESEISQLKSGTEWADPLWKRDQDVKEMVKEEQPLSAEELIKTIHPDTSNLDYISKTGVINGSLYLDIKRIMHQFRDQGRDLDQIEKDFIAWDTENGFNSSQRDILNWFKQHRK